ncbi:MAG: hypothetical protein ACREJF_05475, partial [Candidatus Methylomirabilales bacterium]
EHHHFHRESRRRLAGKETNMRVARVGGLAGLALLAGCLVVAPSLGPAPEVLSVKEIRAGEVRALEVGH